MITAKRIARHAAFRLATSDRVERIVLGASPVRALAFRHANRYVAGLDEQAALAAARALEREGLLVSIDLFGENVSDDASADDETRRYLALVDTLAELPEAYLSLDCSHLGLDNDPHSCRERVERIARALPPGSRLQLGAEASTRTDAILNLACEVASRDLPIMVTIQANLRRSPDDIDRLAQAQIPIRLVKGAYVEPADLAHPWGVETDRAYIELAQRLNAAGATHSLATHDPAILRHLLGTRDRAQIEFLLGVRERDARLLARQGHDVRIYVPYGERWFRYYARRTAEALGA